MSLPRANEVPWMTGEELFRRPDLNPCELIDGRVVPVSPTGPIHARLEGRLSLRLGSWAEETGLGEVMPGEVGIYIHRNPDTIRGADLLFISHERYARWSGSGFLDVAPELVVEILSPEDRWTEVMAKLADYSSIGVDLVWVVDPKLCRVFAYRSLTEVSQFQEGDTLVAPDVLPGFSLPLADLFRRSGKGA